MISHLSRCNVVLLLAAAGLRGRPKAIVVEPLHRLLRPPSKGVSSSLMRKLYPYADAVVASDEMPGMWVLRGSRIRHCSQDLQSHCGTPD